MKIKLSNVYTAIYYGIPMWEFIEDAIAREMRARHWRKYTYSRVYEIVIHNESINDMVEYTEEELNDFICGMVRSMEKHR